MVDCWKCILGLVYELKVWPVVTFFSPNKINPQMLLDDSLIGIASALYNGWWGLNKSLELN